MNLGTLQDLRSTFKRYDDDMALCALINETLRCQNEYFGLCCIAKAARDLNPLVVEINQGARAHSPAIEKAYASLMELIKASLDARIEAHLKNEQYFAYDESSGEFLCRRCGKVVGWYHKELKDHIVWSSEAEGNEPEGLCHECWSLEVEG